MSDLFDSYIRAGEDTSVCFARRSVYGSMLLSVRDDGTVDGVLEITALSIDRSISNVTSNSKQFNVSPQVEFERLRDPGGGLVIRVLP